MGLYLDPHLTFKYHVSVLSSRIAKGLYIIKNSKRLLSEKALRLLYFSLIHSHIIYAIQAYGCADKSVLQPIIKLQKKAIRIVSNSKYNAHCDPIFKEIEILKFEDLVDLDIKTFTIKSCPTRSVATLKHNTLMKIGF